MNSWSRKDYYKQEGLLAHHTCACLPHFKFTALSWDMESASKQHFPVALNTPFLVPQHLKENSSQKPISIAWFEGNLWCLFVFQPPNHAEQPWHLQPHASSWKAEKWSARHSTCGTVVLKIFVSTSLTSNLSLTQRAIKALKFTQKRLQVISMKHLRVRLAGDAEQATRCQKNGITTASTVHSALNWLNLKQRNYIVNNLWTKQMDPHFAQVRADL